MLEAPKISKPPFHSLLVKKQEGNIHFIGLGNYETRNESVMSLILMADSKYNFHDFDWILINTDDRDLYKMHQGLKVLSFSTVTDNYSQACPDFVFDHWKQVRLDDYEETRKAIAKIGSKEPESDRLGWRGAKSHPNRKLLVQLHDQTNIDAEFVEWDRRNSDRLTCPNYVSLPDHPRKWRYIIDVEGSGYSGRLKLFLFSKRVVFLVDRPYKEWYFPLLKPFEHYVPVRRDMSNLLENLNRIRRDRSLENQIRQNAFAFAERHLTRDAALARWNELLG